MDHFHKHLAQLGLSAGARYGLALAGGYAVQVLGMLERPSEDVDLFAAWDRRDEFDDAVAAVVAAYAGDGLQVRVDRRQDTFARLEVTDPNTRDTAKVELAVDYRANQPVQLAFGPVLHPDDAVANKMAALFSRAQARDFIDVHAAARSGYSREHLLSLAERADSGFDRRLFADAVGQAATIPGHWYGRYGLRQHQVEEVQAWFADWRAELLAE